MGPEKVRTITNLSPQPYEWQMGIVNGWLATIMTIKDELMIFDIDSSLLLSITDMTLERIFFLEHNREPLIFIIMSIISQVEGVIVGNVHCLYLGLKWMVRGLCPGSFNLRARRVKILFGALLCLPILLSNLV